jgi:hypothetical protein
VSAAGRQFREDGLLLPAVELAAYLAADAAVGAAVKVDADSAQALPARFLAAGFPSPPSPPPAMLPIAAVCSVLATLDDRAAALSLFEATLGDTTPAAVARGELLALAGFDPTALGLLDVTARKLELRPSVDV